MNDDPAYIIDWHAFGPLLKDAQDRLGRVETYLEKLENKGDLIKEGVNIIHEDQLTARSEVRLMSNRLKVVETTARLVEQEVRMTGHKIDLILKHLGLDRPEEPLP